MDPIPIISPLRMSDAFQVFARYVAQGLPDFAGQRIEVDFGDYTHVIRDEDRIQRISWLAPTAQEPARVWRRLSRKPGKRQRNVRQQTYVKWIRPDEMAPPELFVLGTELLPSGQLRLRTWYSAHDPEGELAQLARGEQIWPLEQK